MFVVDATVGATDTDEAVVRLLRRSGKPVVLVRQQGRRPARRGRRRDAVEPRPRRAVPGLGRCTAAGAATCSTPSSRCCRRCRRVGDAARAAARAGSRSSAGPNVGKSSLLNKLAGAERVVVDDVAGTTRDPVDELIELGGKTWRFVDTAGIRRRVHQTRRRRLLRLAAHPGRAGEGRGRRRPASTPSEPIDRAGHPRRPAGRRRRPRPRHRLQQVGPRSTRSAATTSSARSSRSSSRCSGRRGSTSRPRTGRHMDRLVPGARDARSTSWETRVPTGRLNAFLGEIVAAHPHPVRGGKQPRILFATQASTRPPRFVLFASGFLEAGLPPVHRAAAARGVRLRGDADRGVGAGAGEASPVTS